MVSKVYLPVPWNVWVNKSCLINPVLNDFEDHAASRLYLFLIEFLREFGANDDLKPTSSGTGQRQWDFIWPQQSDGQRVHSP